LRYAPAQDTTVAVPAISSRVSGDLYVTLLSAARNGTVTVRVARNPMIGLVWGGGGLMALCGLASLAMAGPGRRRVRRRPRRRVVEPEALPSPRRAPELVARSES
jgi:cytochrome c-type biogenesis protein CcmF